MRMKEVENSHFSNLKVYSWWQQKQEQFLKGKVETSCMTAENIWNPWKMKKVHIYQKSTWSYFKYGKLEIQKIALELYKLHKVLEIHIGKHRA